MPEHTPDQTPQEIADEALSDSPSRRKKFEEPTGVKRLFGKRKRQKAAADALAEDTAEAHMANDLIDAKRSKAATQRRFEDLQGEVEEMVQTAQEFGHAKARHENGEAEEAKKAEQAAEQRKELLGLESVLNKAFVDAVAKGEVVKEGPDTTAQLAGETENPGSGPDYPEDISLIRREINKEGVYVVQVSRQESKRRKRYRFPDAPGLPQPQRGRKERYAGVPLVIDKETYVLGRDGSLAKSVDVVVNADDDEELKRLRQGDIPTGFRVTEEDIPAHEVRDLAKLVARAKRVPVQQG